MYILDYPVPLMHSAFHNHDTVLVGWYTLISPNIVLSAFRQHTFSIEVLLIRVWHYTSIGTHVPGQTNACNGKTIAKKEDHKRGPGRVQRQTCGGGRRARRQENVIKDAHTWIVTAECITKTPNSARQPFQQ